MNYYYHTQIHLAGLGHLQVSHFCFTPGSLLHSEQEANIHKPVDYANYYNKRKETFLAGRLAVVDAQACLKTSIQPIPKARDGSPIWPNDYTGSISHTDTQAVAVLLPKVQTLIKGIGIDIERIDSAEQLEAQDMIGTAAEFKRLSELKIAQGMSDALVVLLLFSLKESVYKALYPIVGEFFDFLDAQLIRCENMAGENIFALQITCDLGEQVQKGFQLQGSFTVCDDHLLTWAYW